MPYVAKFEKAGIPTVVVDYPDMEPFINQKALESGIPKIRYVRASRRVHGTEDADTIMEQVIEGLTKPLTKKEKGSGRWEPPPEPRILFEGTLDEAQAFYQQTRHIPPPLDAPICVYTDGFPIIVPTEERVQEMLKGTSHKPDELITYQSDRPVMREAKKKGEVVEFQPKKLE